jgi:hypothetical protein
MKQHPVVLHPADRRGEVLTKAVLNVSDKLAISGSRLAEVLGVSAASISRMKQQSFALAHDSKPYELAAQLVRLYRSLDAIVGGDDAVAAAWFRNRNLALGGVPCEMITSIQGLFDVIAYLDARRAQV